MLKLRRYYIFNISFCWHVHNFATLKKLKGFRQVEEFPKHSYPVTSATFIKNGSEIISSSMDGTIQIWNLAQPSKSLILRKSSTRFKDAQLSPDGNWIGACSDTGSITLWNANTNKEVWTSPGDGKVLTAVQFSLDSTMVLCSSTGGTIKLWDIRSRQEKKTLIHPEWVTGLQCLPNGRVLSSSFDATSVIWEMEAGEKVHVFEGHSGPVMKAQFCSEKNYVVTCSKDKTVRVWDVESGKEVRTLGTHEHVVTCVKFFPDGKTVVSSSGDTIQWWNITTGEMIDTLKSHHNVVKMDVSPNSDIVSCADDTIKLWTLDRKKRHLFN
ncbi:WD repeat-containing protein [Reticulomyxa filosa]|uniref:WD repeat-containing protein n=1 Tax=Reticulomyxa filosa TaxID=46433 RepID=X6PCS3_RETFI|nr:WD repeat-containing protein [Reticulomyxa filosa]|eukprot:ETO35462.1 WD repeat-containing protein [Reticulomyxa filosa]